MSNNMPKPTLDDSPEEIVNVTDPDDDQYVAVNKAKRPRGMDLPLEVGVREEPQFIISPKTVKPYMVCL